MSESRRKSDLSPREEEILCLAGSGLTDKMICEAVGIRPGTINDYWARIRLKLGAASRTEAVAGFAAQETEKLEDERRRLLSELAEHKKIEEELRISEEAWRALLGSVIEGIVVSERGRVVFVNNHLLRLTGYSAEEALGEESLTLMRRFARPGEPLLDPTEDVARGDDTRFEYSIEAKDGRTLWFLVGTAGFQGAGGAPMRVSVLTDITEMKQVEAELREALARAEGEIACLRTSAGG
jgi:PAS domain S-box-containing protein